MSVRARIDYSRNGDAAGCEAAVVRASHLSTLFEQESPGPGVAGLRRNIHGTGPSCGAIAVTILERVLRANELRLHRLDADFVARFEVCLHHELLTGDDHGTDG